MNSKKEKHLELIQTVITRMARNSFSLKGWAITLVSGLFALASKDADKQFFIVAYLPIVLFWWLDAYYLLQERLYRSLYDKTRNLSEDLIDYNMNISLPEFHVSPNSFLQCLVSKTEIMFYVPLALVSTAIILLIELL